MARRFLEEHSSSARVRAAMATDRGFDPEVWQRIGGELGWTAMIVPEAYGGFGFTYVELIAVMEEMGRALLCAPFFSSICLAANALLVAGDEAQKEAHLPGIASGDTRAALAWMEPNGRFDAGGIAAVARPDGADFLLSGTKTFVIDGHTADLLIVAARTPGSSGEHGIGLFLVPADAPGIDRRPLPTMDQTRKQAELVLSSVRVPASDRLSGDGWAALSRTLELAAIALAAEQAGGAQRCLELAVDYAKVRIQFGRPIGSFQAIKHMCADMLLQVESARSAAWYAGWAAAHGGEALSIVAPMARAWCSDAYFHCAAESIQIHGGIGFTWEHDAHLYFKRARASAMLLGDSSLHCERLAQAIGLAGGEAWT
jgi:alkylation response protein AidB-like acyl-CoA dehydrogenase